MSVPYHRTFMYIHTSSMKYQVKKLRKGIRYRNIGIGIEEVPIRRDNSTHISSLCIRDGADRAAS